LRPNRKCCDRNLPPDATYAMICIFECTFCRNRVETKLGGRSPNFSGNLVSRPIRPTSKLAKYPPSTERIFKPQSCGKAV